MINSDTYRHSHIGLITQFIPVASEDLTILEIYYVIKVYFGKELKEKCDQNPNHQCR